MKITLNPDKEVVKVIKEGLKRTGGYCPCIREQSEDTKCANSKVTKADATLYTVTLNSVETKPNIQIAVLPEFGKKENN